ALFTTTLFRTIAAGGSVASLKQLTPATFLMLWAYTTAASCIISTALWILLASIACIMFLHRLVWPLTSRLLYAHDRYRLVQNKVALNAAGATLAGIAITGGYGGQSILKLFGFT